MMRLKTQGLAGAAFFTAFGAVTSHAQMPPVPSPGHVSVEVPELTTESFKAPPPSVRPKYRWWIPRGGADENELLLELKQLQEAGAGGAEISPFPLPGGAQQTGQGLAATGWESDRWRSLRLSLFEAAARLGFLLDDTMSGLGSDAISVPHPGAVRQNFVSKRAVAGYRLLRNGHPFDGRLPPTPLAPLASALCGSAAAGETRIYPVLTGWLAPGDVISVGEGGRRETAIVESVGSGSWGCGATLAPLAAGDGRLFVSPLKGGGGMDPAGRAYTQFNIGQRLKIGSGSHSEIVEVLSLGEAAAEEALQLAAPSNQGAQDLQIVFTPNFYGKLPVREGHVLWLGGNNGGEKATVVEARQKDAVILVRLAAPLTHDHPAGPIQNLGEGFRTTPLARAHPQNAEVAVEGSIASGIELTAPLVRDHGIMSAVSREYEQTLIAALAYRCVADCSADVKTLDRASAVNLTEDARDGRIDDTRWRSEGDWILFVQRMAADEPFHKGAFSPHGFDFAVDHLSEAGADALKAYWSEKLLTPAMRAALDANRSGRAAVFEDSLEMPFTQKWTDDFVSQWAKRRGYDPTPLLPALFNRDQQARAPSGFMAQFMPRERFLFKGINADRIGEDYRQTWSDLFRERFVAPIARWANEEKLATRFQLYGSFPIDTSWASSVVTIPEGEALGFDDDISTYSIIASGAHMSGEAVVSNECCAAQGQAYRDPFVGIDGSLAQVFQAFAGGVNQQIWHGFDYNATATSQWPGYHAWSAEGGTSEFSEAFGPRLPFWQTGAVRAANDAIARTSLMLRQGAPRVDLAVYHLAFGRGLFQGPEAPALKPDGILASEGYTMGFISPEYLNGDPAKLWREGKLFPERAQYQAFVLDRVDAMSVSSAEAILALARAGMKLLVIGDLPKRATGHDRSGEHDAKVAAVAAKLRSMAAIRGNVTIVASEKDAPEALRTMRVSPAARPQTPSPVTTVRRQSGDKTYYYFYNGGEAAVAGRWTLMGKGVPVMLDPWRGTTEPIAQYVRSKETVSIDLSIGPRGIALVALDQDMIPGTHVVSSQGGEIGYDANKTLVARSGGGEVRFRLVDGQAGARTIEEAGPARLVDNWTLSLDAALPAPGASGIQAPQSIAKRLLFDRLLSPDGSGKLLDWSALGAKNTSGIAIYSTKITLSEKEWGNRLGAYLDLGEILGVASLKVNGVPVLFDLQDPHRIDLGKILVAGANDIEVRVASNLANAVYQENRPSGLTGPVRLVPYREVTLPVQRVE